MEIEERIYYVEKKGKLENDDTLKRIGFKYESAKTLGINKEGYYFYIRGEKETLDKCEVLKNAQEIRGEEKEKILRKMKEIQESAASGVNLLWG